MRAGARSPIQNGHVAEAICENAIRYVFDTAVLPDEIVLLGANEQDHPSPRPRRRNLWGDIGWQPDVGQRDPRSRTR